MKCLYLDYMATTPLDKRVLAAMMPYLTDDFGNPSSLSHVYGLRAKRALEESRQMVAQCLGAHPKEIFFTAGATEGNNFVLKGMGPRHLVSSAIEHKSVLAPAQELGASGVQISLLPVNEEGELSLAQVEEVLKSSPDLLSIMAANNEIGTVNPLAELGALCGRYGVAFHSDAAQAAGKTPLDVKKSAIHFLTISAHKFYGPKGVGALYIEKSWQQKLKPLIHGGAQERGLRSGTQNLAGIVGMARALELACQHRPAETQRLERLREQIWHGLAAQIPGIKLNGPRQARLCHNLHLTIPGISAQRLMLACPELAFSASSACSSNKSSQSHVLSALGLDPELIPCSFRLSLGQETPSDSAAFIVDRLVEASAKVRSGFLQGLGG